LRGPATERPAPLSVIRLKTAVQRTVPHVLADVLLGTDISADTSQMGVGLAALAAVLVDERADDLVTRHRIGVEVAPEARDLVEGRRGVLTA
jgi:hypothetical protein